MKPSRFAVAHPVIVSMTLLALLVFGAMSLSTTNTEFLSDISMPQVIVVTIYPGASAEDIEQTVTNVLEDDFVTLPNFKSMDSQSLNSASIVTITFQDGIDPYDQINEVRNRINQLVSDLPDGISGTPEAIVGGTSLLPIASFVVEGQGDLNAISDYIEDELKPQLTRIEGVSTITVNGSKTPRLDIKLRTDDLDARGISPVVVYQVLNLSNYSIPLDTASYSGHEIDAKFDGKFTSLEDVQNLPVGLSADGGIIRIKDVADVSFVYNEGDYYVSKDGKQAITVDICKRSDGNTIKITNEIKKILANEEKSHGGALKFTMVNDDSTLVNSSLSTVIQSGVMGVIIAILVIFIFLSDIKATIVIGLSIPLSIFFTFIGMKLMGITVNLMSLSGIVVALGNIVGAAILVLDQVYRYYQSVKDGKALYSVNDSIFKGSDTVIGSVLGSGLTTIVVFIPIAVMSGLVGKILKDVSVTFMLALSASLLVAIIYIPYFLKKLLKEDVGARKKAKDNIVVRALIKIEAAYNKSLHFAVDHTFFILLMAVMVLALSFYVLPNMQFAFIPSTDNGDFYINIELPEGYSLEDTKEVMAKAEEILIKEVPELKTDVVFAGKSMDPTDYVAKKNQGAIHAVLVPVKDRDRGIHEIILDVQKAVASQIPDATVSVDNGGFDRLISMVSGGGGYGLTLVGTDSGLLFETAERIEAELKKDNEVITTSINATNDSRSAVINATYDYMSSLGVSSQEAGLTSAILFYGTDIGKFTNDATNDRYDIHIYSDIASLPISVDRLAQIKLHSLAGTEIPLSNIASLDMEQAVSQINHTDRAMTLTITAKLTTESTDGVSARINKYLEKNPIPAGITTEAGGLNDLVNDSLGPLVQALLVAMFLVYLVMVAVFERYDQPLLIMLLFPFCIIGAVLALSAFGSSLSIVSILGIVSLVGMLVNNGIVIADYVNISRKMSREMKLTARGVSFDEFTDTIGLLSYDEEIEILREDTASGSASRLRPILMSTLTTVLGVIPMAIAKGEGAEIYAPLGQVIMGGLATSTILTLYIMPVYYFILEKHRLKKKYKKLNKENLVKETNDNEKNDK